MGHMLNDLNSCAILQIFTLFVKFLWPIYVNGFVYYDCMLTNTICISLTLTAFAVIVKK